MTGMGDSKNFIEVLRKYGKNLHSIAEIGCHKGTTSALILYEFPKVTLYMVDPWATYEPSHPYRKSGDGCSKFTREQQDANRDIAVNSVMFAGSRAQILENESLVGARILQEQGKKLSAVLLDGDHTEQAVHDDTYAWWPLLERGGIFAWHDYAHRRFTGVAKAVNEFVRIEGLPLQLDGTLAWVIKP